MNVEQETLLQYNKYLEDQLSYIIHTVNNRIDKLIEVRHEEDVNPNRRRINNQSSLTFLTFRTPYIRDFKNFSSPVNEDTRQINQLPTGLDNVDQLSKQRFWSKEAKVQLEETVLENYSRNHIIKLIKQKNQLLNSNSVAPEDVAQKVRLIDEQTDQVKTRYDPRIFVPQDPHDNNIDWCAVSAKLSSYHYDANDCRLMWSNQLHWSINNNTWAKDEDICLINAVAKHGKQSWDVIAAELNTGRLAWQCCARYHQEFADVQSPDGEEADRILEVINLCRIGNFVPWNQVMYFIQFHALHQVKYLWQRYRDQQCSGTRPWSEQEDLKLLKAVAKYGEKDWTRIAECVEGRTNKSCRERYIMRARFAKRAIGGWTRHEDARLLALINQFGTIWSMIMTHFPERNSHQLRNRFELLKSHVMRRKGPIKHRSLYRSLTTQSVNYSKGPKRLKTNDEKEIDRKLHEIFSTYKSIAPKKSLTTRSSQDEHIYQSLIGTLSKALLGHDDTCSNTTSLNLIMNYSVNTATFNSDGSFVLCPSKPTLQAYRAWSLQQDYLNQFGDADIQLEDIDERMRRIIVGLFLMPAILSRIRTPIIDTSKYQIGNLIDKESKNLYKVRNLQRHFL